MLSSADVCGIPIHRVTEYDLIDRLYQHTQEEDEDPVVVSFINANSLVIAHKDASHKRSLLYSDYRIADGWPVAKLAKTQKISGPDFMLSMARDHRINKMRHVLVGGKGVAYKAAREQWSVAMVGEKYSPFILYDGEEIFDHPEHIPECDFLWVALGCPKQEAWIIKHRFDFRASTILGVGAAFNFLAGEVKRAPVWMQKSGLECIHRIYAEPKRWRRQVGSILGFVRLLLMR